MVRTCILCLVLSIFVTDPPFIGFFVSSQFAFAFALAFTFASALLFASFYTTPIETKHGLPPQEPGPLRLRSHMLDAAVSTSNSRARI